jgi:Cdc6-like AAA superfamily ATPase
MTPEGGDPQRANSTSVRTILNNRVFPREFFKLGDIKKRAISVISESVLHEKKNIEKLLDAGMSAFPGEPTNLIITGPPTEGKTFLIVNALKVFPEEYVEVYRDASPKSFTRGKGQLALRIIEDEEKKFVTPQKIYKYPYIYFKI